MATQLFAVTGSTLTSANDAYTLRNLIPVSGPSLGAIRIGIATGVTAQSFHFVANHIAVGIWNGTAADCISTPVEFTTNNQPGFSFPVPGGDTVFYTDWLNFGSFTASNKLVVILEVGTGDGGGYDTYYNAGTSGATVFYIGNGAPNIGVGYKTALQGGTEQVGFLYSVYSIETQPANW
jgi:hypothetical protein